MIDLATLKAMSSERAQAAAKQRLIPFVPFDAAEIEGWDSFPFPNIGDHRPEGWELVDTLFCDSSGFGATNEPALTATQLKDKLLENVSHGYGYAVIQEGQFQLYVGVFKRL